MKKLIILLTCLPMLAFAQAKAKKANAMAVATFCDIVIVDGSSKHEISPSQFTTADGYAMFDGKKTQLWFGASNNNNERSYSFSAYFNTDKKGVFQIGEGSGNYVNVGYSPIPNDNAPLMSKSGSITISDYNMVNGYVVGSFTATCTGVANADGKAKEYQLSGSFKLKRMQ